MAMMETRVGYKASTILASQEMLKWLALNSKGNVDIQTKNFPHYSDPDGMATEGRLFCTHCKAAKVFAIDVFLDETKLLEELQWAKQHKHDNGPVHVHEEVPVTSTGERRLKVVQ